MLLIVVLMGVSGTQKAQAFYQDDAQQTASFTQYKGKVLDASSKKPLVFANLAVEGSNVSTITNTEGEFNLKVPSSADSGKVVVSFLGYKTKTLQLAQLTEKKNQILMSVSALAKNAKTLVKETLAKKGQNYFKDPTLMTAFYRETIKKRRKNVSLSEAVVNIYKTPYSSQRRDAVELYKARKSTDYSKLDTVALKLQGGPFNALFVDIMKYPEYIFTKETIEDYEFSFDRSTRVNDKLIYIIDFKQFDQISYPLYKGKLYIDAENKILTSAIYSLNITDREKAAKLFVRKKPRNAKVWPSEVAYRVDYREKNGKWYYGIKNCSIQCIAYHVKWRLQIGKRT